MFTGYRKLEDTAETWMCEFPFETAQVTVSDGEVDAMLVVAQQGGPAQQGGAADAAAVAGGGPTGAAPGKPASLQPSAAAKASAEPTNVSTADKIPDKFKGLVFTQWDNQVLQLLKSHQRQRVHTMSPYMVSGLGAHIGKYGPMEQCKANGGDKWRSTLWPPAVDVDACETELRYQAETNSWTVPLGCVGTLEEQLTPVGNAAKWDDDTLQAPPSTVSAKMAVPFMMLAVERLLQTRSASLVIQFVDKDGCSCDMLIAGSLRNLESLHRAVELADGYAGGAELEIAKLRAEDLEFDDKRVADLILPYIVDFKLIFDKATLIKNTMSNSIASKLKHYLDNFANGVRMLIDPDWKVVFGIPDYGTKNNKKIKKIFKDEARYKKVGPAKMKLAKAISAVGAYNGHIVRLESALQAAETVVHDATLYMAMIGLLNNTIVKPAQGYPIEALKTEAKKCAFTIHTKYKLWLPREDGKDIVPTEILSKSNFGIPILSGYWTLVAGILLVSILLRSPSCPRWCWVGQSNTIELSNVNVGRTFVW